MRMLRINFVRYMLIASIALFVGIAANFAVQPRPPGDNINPIISFLSLFWFYGVLHIISASATRLVAFFWKPHFRSVLYVAASVIGFLASLIFLPFDKYHGFHLFVIYWGSLLLISIDYFGRVRKTTSAIK